MYDATSLCTLCTKVHYEVASYIRCTLFFSSGGNFRWKSLYNFLGFHSNFLGFITLIGQFEEFIFLFITQIFILSIMVQPLFVFSHFWLQFVMCVLIAHCGSLCYLFSVFCYCSISKLECLSLFVLQQVFFLKMFF